MVSSFFQGNNSYIHTYIMTKQYGADLCTLSSCKVFLFARLIYLFEFRIKISIWIKAIAQNRLFTHFHSMHATSFCFEKKIDFFVGNTNWKMTLLCKCNDCFYSRGILSSVCCKSKYFPIFSSVIFQVFVHGYLPTMLLYRS